MERWAVLVAAVVPALLILGYGVAKTRGIWQTEALSTAFLVGAAAGVPAVLVEQGLTYVLHIKDLSPVVRAAADAFVVAAIPEEAIKFIVLIGVAEKHVDARRVQDIVLLALSVSLGFAALENIAYVAAPGDWKLIAIRRAITAVPGHGIFGLAMGALLTLARIRLRGWWGLALALAVPIGLHGAYDFPLMLAGSNEKVLIAGGWVAVMVASAVVAIVLCNRALTAAVKADRVSGRDLESSDSRLRAWITGILLLSAGFLLGVAAVPLKQTAFIWIGASLGIFPAALGIDLLISAVQRQRARGPAAG